MAREGERVRMEQGVCVWGGRGGLVSEGVVMRGSRGDVT